MRLFIIALLTLTLSGCLTAPADIQAEFEPGAPNHYRPAGVIFDTGAGPGAAGEAKEEAR